MANSSLHSAICKAWQDMLDQRLELLRRLRNWRALPRPESSEPFRRLQCLLQQASRDREFDDDDRAFIAQYVAMSFFEPDDHVPAGDFEHLMDLSVGWCREEFQDSWVYAQVKRLTGITVSVENSEPGESMQHRLLVDPESVKKVERLMLHGLLWFSGFKTCVHYHCESKTACPHGYCALHKEAECIVCDEEPSSSSSEEEEEDEAPVPTPPKRARR